MRHVVFVGSACVILYSSFLRVVHSESSTNATHRNNPYPPSPIIRTSNFTEADGPPHRHRLANNYTETNGNLTRPSSQLFGPHNNTAHSDVEASSFVLTISSEAPADNNVFGKNPPSSSTQSPNAERHDPRHPPLYRDEVGTDSGQKDPQPSADDNVGEDDHSGQTSELMAGSETGDLVTIRNIIDQQSQLCPFTPQCRHEPLRTTHGQDTMPVKDTMSHEVTKSHQDKMSHRDTMTGQDRQTSCCSSCSCDIDCITSGTCCPDRFMSIVEKTEIQCITPQWKKRGLSDVNTNSMMMVSACGSYIKNDSYKFRCDKSQDIDLMSDIFILAPVESTRSGQIFKNKYCAYCHSVDDADIETWLPWLECKGGTDLPSFTSMSFLSSLNKTRACNVLYKPAITSRAFIQKCVAGAITTCNETGLWETYDHVVDKACNLFTSWYNKTYRNVFCHICNTNVRPIQNMCDLVAPKHVPDWEPASFSTLLNFNSFGEGIIPMDSKCTSGYMWDPYQNMCRSIHCSLPRRLHDKECSTLPNQTELYVEFYIRMEPIVNITLYSQKPNISDIHAIVNNWLTAHGIGLNFICKFDIYNINKSTDTPDTSPIIIHLIIGTSSGSDIESLVARIADFNYGSFLTLLDIGNWTVFLDGKHFEPEDYLPTVQIHISEKRQRDFEARQPCSPAIRITALNECPQFYLEDYEFRLMPNNGIICLRKSKKCFPKDRYVEIDGRSAVAKDIGYGGVFCYISTETMVRFIFALPVGLVVIANIIMFLVVVYRIHSLPSVKKHSVQERNNFLIYVKLSTLTGVSWMFEFIYQWTGITVFQYLSIVTSCGQGVFIMLSFVCNARVKDLYVSRWYKAHNYRDRSVKTNSGTMSLRSIPNSCESSIEAVPRTTEMLSLHKDI
ncbi:hypothetical protein ScPMuIL_013739 [Solemya velum]